MDKRLFKKRLALGKIPGYFCMIILPETKAALVDAYWWVQIRRLNWKVRKSRGGYYAYTRTKRNGKSHFAYMHRLVMACPKGLQVHHKNRNTLDNRVENLEIVTPAEHELIRRRSRITKYKDPIPYKILCGLNVV